MEPEQKQTLIDILYKDEYRIDSYMAQLLDGALRSVKQQENTSQGSSHSFDVNFKMLKYQKNNKNLTTALNEYSIDPHDHNVISLLAALDLTPIAAAPTSSCLGRLVHLQATLSIRDFRLFENLIPSFTNNSKALNLGHEKKDMKNVKAIWDVLKNVIPLNIEAECQLSDTTIIRGMLKSEYMVTDYRDILSLYNGALPGIWNIIGIMDSTSRICTAPSSAGIRSALDGMTSAATMLYKADSSEFTISPIIIYRELNK